MTEPTKEMKAAVERLRAVWDEVREADRAGRPPTRSNVAALIEAAHDAQPLQGEIGALAAALAGIGVATLHAWDAAELGDAAALARVEEYGSITGQFLLRLAELAEVPLTTYADEQAEPGPQH